MARMNTNAQAYYVVKYAEKCWQGWLNFRVNVWKHRRVLSGESYIRLRPRPQSNAFFVAESLNAFVHFARFDYFEGSWWPPRGNSDPHPERFVCTTCHQAYFPNAWLGYLFQQHTARHRTSSSLLKWLNYYYLKFVNIVDAIVRLIMMVAYDYDDEYLIAF